MKTRINGGIFTATNMKGETTHCDLRFNRNNHQPLMTGIWKAIAEGSTIQAAPSGTKADPHTDFRPHTLPQYVELIKRDGSSEVVSARLGERVSATLVDALHHVLLHPGSHLQPVRK